jgi:hypothetical protein
MSASGKLSSSVADWQSADVSAPQAASLRYGRQTICATTVGLRPPLFDRRQHIRNHFRLRLRAEVAFAN